MKDSAALGNFMCRLAIEEGSVIGMKVPIRLIGSKEANRLRFEAVTEAMRKKGL